MASFLRKLRPSVSSSVHDDGDDYSVEYSFAIEYSGPPLSFSIPEAAPFKIEQIPVASVAPSSADQFPVPIIQPIVKTKTNVKLDANVLSSNSKSPATELAISGSSESTNSESFSIKVESSSRINKSSSLNRTDDALKCSTGNLTQRLQISGSFEVSGRGEILQVLPENEMNPTNSDITESGSGSTSGLVSSEIFSCREDDCNNDTPRHVRRPSAVTFLDSESNYTIVNENFDGSQAASTPVRPRVERTGKKGTCYRCNRGNRFTEKEICIVCSAKFCKKCVLRAMGSMPEGRKCITCIGYRIDENMRRIQGKCSRMLKQLLSEMELKQIMEAELNCETNQIPPELVFVNEEHLDREQLILLLSCPKPPRKLKPGSYWYDKASGFWGKEGQAPCQIVSPQLDVGGTLQKHASNGNTNVHINGREITKKELKMLKIAGVPCEGTPNFWVSADGSYQEEGQQNVKERRIWDKTTVRLLCMLLSMPVPSNSVAASGEGEGEKKIKGDLEQRNLYKFLLVGSIKSGTSTIFKQARHLYDIPFSEEERQNIKLVIQSNLYTYLGILLEARENFEEESLLERRKRRLVDESTSTGNTDEITDTTIYSIGPRLKAFSDWLLKYMVSGNLDAILPAATRVYARLVEELSSDSYALLVEELWSDAAIQATFNRRNELEMLPRGASYFLDRVVEISKVDYEPSDVDIIYAEGITLSNSLTSVEFSFPKTSRDDSLDPDYQLDPSLKYQLIRVHPKSLGEKCKWLEMFEDIDVVLFCVALTDYDEYTVDRNGVSTNKMLAAKRLFENIVTHPSFTNKKFLLILTKFDLLEEKIDAVPLTQCEWFCDFNPVISQNQNRSSNYTNNPPLAQRAFQYIAAKFKTLFHSLTSQKLFVSLVTGLEPDTVDEALRYARDVMLWQKWFPSLLAEKSENEITSTSYDEQSS